MPDEVRMDLLGFLKENEDIFLWTATDMPRIDPRMIFHNLNVDPIYKPIRQKKKLFTIERLKAIDKEVNKLLDANFIRDVQYPNWLANVVMVKKAHSK